MPLSVVKLPVCDKPFGTQSVPEKDAGAAVAVKVTPTVQLLPVIPLGASVVLEHGSDAIAKFGEAGLEGLFGIPVHIPVVVVV